MSDPNELEALKARIWASYPALILLELDAGLPFPEGATGAISARLARVWAGEDPEALKHALRGEHFTEEEAIETGKQDRIRFNELLAENDAREARENAQYRNEKDAA